MKWRCGVNALAFSLYVWNADAVKIWSCSTKFLFKGNMQLSNFLNYRRYLPKALAAFGSALSIFGQTPLINNFVYAATDMAVPALKKGKLTVEGEASRIFMKGRQCESDYDYETAQKMYEQVIEAEPDFIYAWSNLGNVLTAEGDLSNALLCYKKALSLSPPGDTSAIILLNKASIETNQDQNAAALRDIDMAEKLIGPDPKILTNRAAALSNLGRWPEACATFEKVIDAFYTYASFSSPLLPQLFSNR